VKCPDAQEILYTIKERQYFEHIDKAYNYASQLLLDLLMNEKNLMARLRLAQFPHLLERPGFFLESSRTCKVLENHFGPGKSWKNVLESRAFF